MCSVTIDWTAVMTGLAAVAAFATAWATFRMVTEIKMQREAAYRPFLTFEKAPFSVQASVKGVVSYPTKWNESIVQDVFVNDPSKFQSNKYDLKLYNIGFAAAKNVQVRISFDRDGFLDTIKKLEKKVPKEFWVRVETGDFFITFYTNEENPWRGIGFSKNIGSETDLVAILPVNITKEFSLVSMPSAFLELLNLYIFYLGIQLGKTKENIAIPEILININYENIFNEKVVQVFSINTEVHSFGGGTFSGQFILREAR